jgi:DNA-binding transcriptional LysR family regulator
MTNLTFKQLEAVHQVARSGTVVKAAESLHVTPAALTSRIKLLEEDLGLALFDRTGNRLRPTDAGREAVAAAARIDRVIWISATLLKP